MPCSFPCAGRESSVRCQCKTLSLLLAISKSTDLIIWRFIFLGKMFWTLSFFVAGCDWFVCLFVCLFVGWFVCLLVCFLVCLDNWLVWSGFVWLTICGDPTKEVHGRVFCWNPSTSCWVKKRGIINPTIPLVQSVEEIRHQLIGSVSQYLQGFIHPRWCRISSTKSIIK